MKTRIYAAPAVKGLDVANTGPLTCYPGKSKGIIDVRYDVRYD